TSSGTLAVFPYLVGDLAKRLMGSFVGEEIGGEGILGTNGLPYPVGTHRPLIDAPRRPIEIRARLSEVLLQERKRRRSKVESGLDPELLHLPGRGWPDPMKLPDRQSLYEYGA